MKQDLRYLKIRAVLSKLTKDELQKIIDFPDEMVYDEFNFDLVKQHY